MTRVKLLKSGILVEAGTILDLPRGAADKLVQDKRAEYLTPQPSGAKAPERMIPVRSPERMKPPKSGKLRAESGGA
jgi:hypothetical protein